MLQSKFLDFIKEQFSDNLGFIPLHEPIFDGNEKQYLNDCIDSTFFSLEIPNRLKNSIFQVT